MQIQPPILDPALVALVNAKAYAALQTPRRNAANTAYEWGTPIWADKIPGDNGNLLWNNDGVLDASKLVTHSPRGNILTIKAGCATDTPLRVVGSQVISLTSPIGNQIGLQITGTPDGAQGANWFQITGYLGRTFLAVDYAGGLYVTGNSIQPGAPGVYSGYLKAVNGWGFAIYSGEATVANRTGLIFNGGFIYPCLNLTVANGTVSLGSSSNAFGSIYGGQIAAKITGTGFSVATGANCKMGTGTLVSGKATISTTAVTSSSFIFLSDAGGGVLANIGSLSVGTVTAGTSFVVNSTNALDSSNFAWIIFEPA
jgi:hypothetical protein